MVIYGSMLVFHGFGCFFHGSRWVFMVFQLWVGFSWFQLDFCVFSWFQVCCSRFQVGFAGFKVVFYGYSWLQVGLYGYSWFLVGFLDSWLVHIRLICIMVP